MTSHRSLSRRAKLGTCSLLALMVLQLLVLLQGIWGQGLLTGPEQLGASSTPLRLLYKTASEQWSKAKSWKQAMKGNPQGACSAISTASLCSGGSGGLKGPIPTSRHYVTC